MYPVLFRIPWDGLPLGGVTIPLFGVGVFLAVWLIVTAWALQAAYLRPPERRVAPPDLVSLIIWFALLFGILRGAEYGRRLAPEGLPLFGYGFMMLCGLMSAIWLATRRAKQAGLEPETIWDLAAWLFIPGIVGARLFYLVQHHDSVYRDAQTVPQVLFATINLSNGGIVLYGGLIAGALGYFAFCYTRKLRPLTLADIITPSIFVGIGFGRLGCLLYGCCYGDRCRLPWGLEFPRGSLPFDALVARGFLPPDAPATPPLHPTQIYSSIDGFLIAALCLWYTKYRRVPGDVLAFALILCPTTRFLLEIVRGDEYGQFGTTLTIAQWISLGLLAVGVTLQLWLSRQTPRLPSTTTMVATSPR